MAATWQYQPFSSHWIAENIAKPSVPAEDEASGAIWDHDIQNAEEQEGQGGVFTGDAGEVAFAFPAVVEESYENLG